MKVRALPILAALLSGSYLSAQQVTDSIMPETVSEAGRFPVPSELEPSLAAKLAGEPVTASDWMVSAAHPLAVKAGADVLRDGGTAADAMVAVQAVLGLVEPQSSGIGGGAFLVWYDAETGELTTLDGRETAPMAATPLLFQIDGEPMGFFDAVVGGRSVGTPGTPALMAQAHAKWGEADWEELFEAAIELAEDGFEVTPRLAGAIAGDAERLSVHPDAAAYFMPNGMPLAAGDILTNAAYAQVLREIADEGVEAFYHGEIAEDIVEAVQGVANNPGILSEEDLANYRVIERPAVCAEYRDHDVCGMGPPSSGALTVGQILGMLDRFDISDANDPNTWRLIGDASRLAFADRGRYMADSDFVPMPTAGLVDPAYLAMRAQLLEGDDALAEVSPGEPPWDHAQLWADNIDVSRPSTSHISIVDSYGNALSMTTTIENGFGSRVMARGFLLNNELTDFSFRSHRDGVPIANRVEPGKRPRSSMAPSIVMKDGAPVLVIGSPGGSRIIGYVAKTIIAYLDWEMDIQQAIAMPHAVNRFGTYDFEAGTAMEAQAAALAALGFETNIRDLNSGLHAIAITENGLVGGADPRREGLAFGE